MPAHAAQGRRAVAYAVAGLVVAATLLLTVGPKAARALGQAHPSAPPPAPSAPSPSPVAASASETPAAAPAPTHSGPYRVVGLGDSVPAGSACDCTSYVSLVAHHEAGVLGTSAAVSNLADGGLTTSDVLDQLTDSSVRRKISDADLVIITVGANDFDTDPVAGDSCAPPDLGCYRSTLREQASRLNDVLKKVEALLGRRSAEVLMTGYWNVFLDGDVAADQGDDYVRNSVALTKAENAQIARTAQDRGATYVDLFTPFKGTSGTRNDTALLADDGDHPNAAGHRKIAKALESALAAS